MHKAVILVETKSGKRQQAIDELNRLVAEDGTCGIFEISPLCGKYQAIVGIRCSDLNGLQTASDVIEKRLKVSDTIADIKICMVYPSAT